MYLIIFVFHRAPFPAISKTDETVNDLDKLKYNARKDELVW